MVGQEDGAGSEKSERKGGGLRKELEATSHYLPWEHLGPMELDAAESTHRMTYHVWAALGNNTALERAAPK